MTIFSFFLFLFSFVVVSFSFLSCSFSFTGIQVGFYLPYGFFLLSLSSCLLINSGAFIVDVPFLLLLLLLLLLYQLY